VIRRRFWVPKCEIKRDYGFVGGDEDDGCFFDEDE